MSFLNILDRLKTAAYVKQRGFSPELAIVRRDDLAQLLKQFGAEDRFSRKLLAERDSLAKALAEMKRIAQVGADALQATARDGLELVVQNEELQAQVKQLELDNESLMHTFRSKAAMNGYQPMNQTQSQAPGDE